MIRSRPHGQLYGGSRRSILCFDTTSLVLTLFLQRTQQVQEYNGQLHTVLSLSTCARRVAEWSLLHLV